MNSDDFERRTISLKIPVDLLSKLDAYAQKLYINRSAAILSLISQGLEQYSAIELLSKFMDKYENKEIHKTDL